MPERRTRCMCDECRTAIDVINEVEESETDFKLPRWKNEELARLNFA
jgi:hypothetical protein